MNVTHFIAQQQPAADISQISYVYLHCANWNRRERQTRRRYTMTCGAWRFYNELNAMSASRMMADDRNFQISTIVIFKLLLDSFFSSFFHYYWSHIVGTLVSSYGVRARCVVQRVLDKREVVELQNVKLRRFFCRRNCSERGGGKPWKRALGSVIIIVSLVGDQDLTCKCVCMCKACHFYQTQNRSELRAALSRCNEHTTHNGRKVVIPKEPWYKHQL